jgi:hypothetical protein
MPHMLALTEVHRNLCNVFGAAVLSQDVAILPHAIGGAIQNKIPPAWADHVADVYIKEDDWL